MSIITIIIMNLLITSIILILSGTLTKNERNTIQNSYAFECGFNSISNGRIPFSYQFFLIAVIFLVFDLEISVIIPIATEEGTNTNSLITMNMIVLGLTTALLLEWTTGLLEWTN